MKSKDEPHLECTDTAKDKIDAVLSVAQYAGYSIGYGLQNCHAEWEVQRNTPQSKLQQQCESHGTPVDLMALDRQQNTKPKQNTDA